MGKLEDLKKAWKRLGTPYKKSEAYKKYGDAQYVAKYEYAKFQSEKKQFVIASDNIEAFEEMLKYWESKGYEIAGPRYSDHTDALKLFYWQKVQKKQ